MGGAHTFALYSPGRALRWATLMYHYNLKVWRIKLIEWDTFENTEFTDPNAPPKDIVEGLVLLSYGARIK